jgi:hypothetical protein
VRRPSAWSLVTAALLLGVLAPATAQDIQPTKEDLHGMRSERPYSPWAGRDFPTFPLWGDTHLHTSYSMDAGAFGARIGPPDAYRFARGEEVESSTGQRVKLARPLDFLVVADHSDGMGFFPDLHAGKPDLLADPLGRQWYEMIQAGQGVEVALDIISRFSQGKLPDALVYTPDSRAYRDAWERTIAAAEEADTPGIFTAFIGYEWTSNTGGNNLHRVVIYRDGAARAKRSIPMATYAGVPGNSDNPRDLWKWMEAYEGATGGQVLAIAHNGNLSNGIMFPEREAFGRDLDRSYVETRARWEPLYEVTQIKGDGETHPFLSPNDEFADYGTWDVGNLDLSAKKTDDMLQREYARSALQIGLELEEKLGTNPYKFGMIGSTDSHTGLTTADEENFFGKHSGSEPSPGRVLHPFMSNENGSILGWQTLASGYAAVWARENTREAIFDAMERRETYATTGPRMLVRFFGGWSFEAADAVTRNPAIVGYGKGVPMGGELHGAPGGASPTFLVAALKDPIGANLDRIQIVKGWLGAKGEREERVYDVAVSGARTIGTDGRCREAVGNTVDPAIPAWSNTIGAPELIAFWTDPDFDRSQRAFYYARVLEIPTPIWAAYDAKWFGKELPPDVPTSGQERAYTSPIWYTPGS